MAPNTAAPPPNTASQRLDDAAAILADALLQAWLKQRRAARMAQMTGQHRTEPDSVGASPKEPREP